MAVVYHSTRELVPCTGEYRFFKNKQFADSWFRLHEKKCTICKHSPKVVEELIRVKTHRNENISQSMMKKFNHIKI